jgi:hypothetical protein
MSGTIKVFCFLHSFWMHPASYPLGISALSPEVKLTTYLSI